MKKFVRILALSLVAVMLCAAFASCAPAKDAEKALEALREAEYISAKDDTVLPVIFAGLRIKGVDTVVTGTAVIDDKAEHVTIVYFEDADAAKAAWEDVKEYAEKEDKDEEDTDWTINKSGKMIYWGTKAAIKATY